MKVRQTVRHFAARKALELPVVGPRVHDKLVDLHTRVFLGWADPDRREERREHLEAFFDASTTVYLTALQEGYTEAQAREITHVIGTFDFYEHGWTEMMEFPAEEVDAHYERYREFFEAHDITVEDPLGEFGPEGGLPEAPATPEKLEDPEYPHAEGGFADDVYTEDETGDVRPGDRDEPEDVDVSAAPGADEE
jgi:hypothetical protein